jgi:anthranilate synthase component 1
MQLYIPEFEQFKRLSGDYNRVPITATLICDDLTPTSAYARLEQGAEHAFLLESVIGGEKIARYSFIGANPRATFKAVRNQSRFAIINRDRSSNRASMPIRCMRSKLI